MPEWKRRLLGLGIPCLLAFAFDIGLTMHGQPAAYWAGDYSRTTEGAPFFRKLFEIHPLAEAAGEALWAGVIVVGLLLLPEVLAVILAVAVVFGHTGGGYTWLGWPIESRWFQTLHGVLFVSATVLGLGLYWLLHVARREAESATTRRLHPVVRWGLIGIAGGLACYMYLIPQ
jgi:hypothetical protein